MIENTGLQGRWQQISTNTFLDVAHNADGFRILKQLLEEYSYDQLHIVLGMVNDKDIDQALAELPKNATYYYCKADIPRGLDEKMLQEKCSQYGLSGNSYPSVNKALRTAQAVASDHDIVVVTGSVFVVAEVI